MPQYKVNVIDKRSKISKARERLTEIEEQEKQLAAEKVQLLKTVNGVNVGSQLDASRTPKFFKS